MKKFDINSLVYGKPIKTEAQVEGQITLQDWMEWKEDIHTRMRDTVENFIVIGYRFKQIKESRMFERDGYENMAEFVKAEYRISESHMDRLMKINSRFSKGGNSMEIRPEFSEYGYSQLQEMLNIADENLDEINPGMTVREIKSIKKAITEDCQKTEEEIPTAAVEEKVATSPLKEPEIEEDTTHSAAVDVPEEIGSENLPQGERWNSETWKEPVEKEKKTIELPPADAQYNYPIGETIFKEIRSGLRFLILRTKDPYRVGNTIHLHEHAGGEETGKILDIEITYMTNDHGGLLPGYVVLQFEVLPPVERQIEGQMSIEGMEEEREDADKKEADAPD